MASSIKNNDIDLPFHSDTAHEDSYTFIDFSNLVETCEDKIGDIIQCRTIGILSSDFGKYYLSHVTEPDNYPRIRLSMVYTQPPQSTVIPYPIQIFGEMQWKNRPVIFAKIIQPMTAAMAIRMNTSLNDVKRLHRNT